MTVEELQERIKLQLPSGWHNAIDKQFIAYTASEGSEVIKYLNEKTGRRFSPVAYESMIRARKASLEDFKKVIDIKCEEWLGTDYAKYLRPSTLFCKKHFDEYLNQVKSRTTYLEDF